MNARSEFTNRRSPGVLSLMNFSEGRVIDTGWRFQIAWAASNQPALRPTRRSGEGGVGDMSGAPDNETPFIEVDRAHAPTASTPKASEANKDFDVIVNLGGGRRSLACVRAQHQAHAFYFRILIRVYIRGEAKDVELLASARRGKKLIDHREGTLVVLNHERQEEPIELRPACRVELRHLLRSEHPGHHHHLHAGHVVAHRVMLEGVGHVLTPLM